MPRITITLSQEDLDWLADRVKEGTYASIAHGVRNAVRLLRESRFKTTIITGKGGVKEGVGGGRT